jgi:hypothetical protein
MPNLLISSLDDRVAGRDHIVDRAGRAIGALEVAHDAGVRSGGWRAPSAQSACIALRRACGVKGIGKTVGLAGRVERNSA